MRRTLIIGDVHGCLQELAELLIKADYHPSDRLIFVGDLINKGPESKGVLELVHRLGAEVVQGNHERAFLEVVQGHRSHAGLTAICRSLGNQLTSWSSWLQSLPVFIEDEHFLVVHAGLQPGKHPRDTSAHILTNIRTWQGDPDNLFQVHAPAWFSFYRESKLVVFGHWAQMGLVVRPNAIGLDSGCVYGNQLTALILPERRLVQVQAKKVYQAIRRKNAHY